MSSKKIYRVEPLIGNDIRTEVHEWCQKIWPAINENNKYAGWHMLSNYTREVEATFDMEFDDSQKAMFFILRWGGICKKEYYLYGKKSTFGELFEEVISE